MNFIDKSSGGGGGDSGGSSTGGRRQQQQEQQQQEEDEEERQLNNQTGQLFPSSSSSPLSSFHPQQQPPYHHQNPRGGWMFEGEPSTGAMMVDNYPITPSADTTNDDDNQQGERGMMMVVEREHMFDKVVTPSDVGKLNRLVIPKQHAERYFPLDSSTNDKGLLLNFEDRNGKPWRFRYSYWNSSQSYVMTKGWSRFVKDKKLDAGDIVSFQRGVGGSAKDRLFIDWRHRPDAPTNVPLPYQNLSSFPLPHHQYSSSFHMNRNIHPWNPLFLQSQPASRNSNLMLPPNYNRYGSGPYHNIGTGSVVNVNQGSGSGSSVIYFRSGVGASGIPQQQQMDNNNMMQMQMHHQRNMGIGMGMGMGMGMGIDSSQPALPPPPPAPHSQVFESVPVVHGKAAAKRLRLFGVNMDCPISDEDIHDQDHYDPLSSSEASNHPMMSSPHYPPTPSSSTIPYLQLRPNYEDHETPMVSSSSTDHAFNKPNKSSSSSHMSLDLDI